MPRRPNWPPLPHDRDALACEVAFLVARYGNRRARFDAPRIDPPAPLLPDLPRTNLPEVIPTPVAPPPPRDTPAAVPDTAARGSTEPRPGRPRPRRLHLNANDLAFLRQLGNTGVAHDRHATDGAGLRPHRIQRLVETGYLQVRRHCLWEHGNVRYYVLGPAGRRVLRREHFGPLYHGHPAQLLHDLKLTDVFYRLPPEARRTWVHEGQIREALRARGHYIRGRCVDAAIIVQGRAVAIEALTPSYKASQIAAKHEAIERFFDGRGLVV